MQFDKSYHIEVAAKAAGTVVFDAEGRILLVRERLSEKAGYWHIPSGSVENGESLENAALRECKEETGLDVTLAHYLDTYVGKFDDGELVLRHVWLAEFDDSQPLKPKLEHEIAEAIFFSIDEIRAMYEKRQLRMHHTLLMCEQAAQLRADLSH
ncbi:DNA mismatch repair protein MutT [Veronia nyctiphanis]|uniref:DNA mismatch repair protein MutT n=1 Tax=Veronia nyctiphanis TaxID=1278244 RepID=A0A4Q0YMX1_9GAMM|nr:NUDIX domain-containing protein [Veronia nyctiphanis]RXJ71725.1 DNA mismatch repair protein MutT [Veronia nyctiphanis]